MWATARVEAGSPGGKTRKTSLRHNPPCKNTPGNEALRAEVEAGILLSARATRCCEATSANFTLPFRRGRDKMAKTHPLPRPGSARGALEGRRPSESHRLGERGLTGGVSLV